jgi:hypothetical protein
MGIKIDRKRLKELYYLGCVSVDCTKCKYYDIGEYCRVNLVIGIIESHTDLILNENFEIPTKITYELKPEFKRFCKVNKLDGINYIGLSMVKPEPEKEEFYNTKTTPDYSKIPIGTVVEINNFEYVGIIYENISGTMSLTTGNNSLCTFEISIDRIKSLTILKNPEVK